uniref:Uncharacterized protein n=1 Tax=Megaselia scalaris TaxID=36166 RepID=T1H504_MEGSC
MLCSFSNGILEIIMTYIFAHLVPQGTPAILMPFMVCIGTIRTLAVGMLQTWILPPLLSMVLGDFNEVGNGNIYLGTIVVCIVNVLFDQGGFCFLKVFRK